eukprot:Nk52_evm3s819 gene=Nk52_evmTU3s819
MLPVAMDHHMESFTVAGEGAGGAAQMQQQQQQQQQQQGQVLDGVFGGGGGGGSKRKVDFGSSPERGRSVVGGGSDYGYEGKEGEGGRGRDSVHVRALKYYLKNPFGGGGGGDHGVLKMLKKKKRLAHARSMNGGGGRWGKKAPCGKCGCLYYSGSWESPPLSSSSSSSAAAASFPSGGGGMMVIMKGETGKRATEGERDYERGLCGVCDGSGLGNRVGVSEEEEGGGHDDMDLSSVAMAEAESGAIGVFNDAVHQIEVRSKEEIDHEKPQQIHQQQQRVFLKAHRSLSSDDRYHYFPKQGQLMQRRNSNAAAQCNGRIVDAQMVGAGEQPRHQEYESRGTQMNCTSNGGELDELIRGPAAEPESVGDGGGGSNGHCSRGRANSTSRGTTRGVNTDSYYSWGFDSILKKHVERASSMRGDTK